MVDGSIDKKKPVSADWFVQGVLTKLGDALDRLTGRGWKPSSSLATSELIERLKKLVDAEAREAEGRFYVPHNIALKMQWDKFSTDSDDALRKLENELLTALVDHINDRRYYTYAPISLKVKPDYFINGVKLFAGFDTAEDEDGEASMEVTVPDLKITPPSSDTIAAVTPRRVRAAARFELEGKRFEKILDMEAGRRFSVGRTKENDLALDSSSVSKMHASLLLNNAGDLVVADTGSTNGTFIDGERIAYGKGIVFNAAQKLRFGAVDVELEVLERQEPIAEVAERPEASEDGSSVEIGEFKFRTKSETPTSANEATTAVTPPPATVDVAGSAESAESETKSHQSTNGRDIADPEVSRNA